VYPEHYAEDARALSDLTLARLALVLARFETEQGRPAAALSDLVPSRLPSVPEDPNTGKPFVYREGRLHPAAAEAGDVIPRGIVRPEWTVRRRMP